MRGLLDTLLLHSAVLVPTFLFLIKGALFLGCLLDFRIGNGWNSMSVGRHIFLLIECVQHDLAIVDLPLFHLLLSDSRTMFVVIEVGLFDWHIDACMDEVETLVERGLQLFVVPFDTIYAVVVTFC